MERKFSIIETKFTPPQLKETIIIRPALTKKLANIKNHPLTIIHAGPGYGKSTALALLLQNFQVRFCWYTISRRDDDFLPFLAHMIYSIRTLIPNFGEELLQVLKHQGSSNYDTMIEFTCSKFINELSKYEEPFVCVLDDFHHIEHSPHINKWMQLLIAHKPDHFHLVISGRACIYFDFLENKRVRGEILEITDKDLSFSKEEIEVLFCDYYRKPLSWEVIEQIYEMTEGWIIAIQMIWQRMKMEPHYPFVKIKSATVDELFRFLTMEVFLKQPNCVQDFLERTSVFEEFSESICCLWFPKEDTRNILEYLIKQNLFITSVGDGQYRYHSLFREFLQTQLSKKIDVFYDTHQRAASYYIHSQDQEKAIFHLLEIKESERVATILQQNGTVLLEAGKVETLLKILKMIPEDIKNQYYMLWFYEGEGYRYRCQYEKALYCYEKVENHANISGDKMSISLGLEGQARVYLDTVQPSKAAPLLRKAVSLLNDLPSSYQERRAALYLLMAENLLNIGDAMEAEKWYLQCKSATKSYMEQELKMVELKSRLYLRTGRLTQAKEVLRRYIEEYGYQTCLSRAHRTVDILLSLVCAYMGEEEEARRWAQSGIIQGDKWKAPFVEACGWTRMGHATQLSNIYDKEVSIQYYETAVRIMDKINISRGKAEPWMGLCLLYGKNGLYDRAIECGMKALSETEKVGDVWLSAFIRLAIGISEYYSNNVHKAREFFQQCFTVFQRCGCQYGLMISCFWLSLLEFANKNEHNFSFFFRRWLQLVNDYHYHFFIEKKTLFGPNDLQSIVPMLLKAKDQGIEKNITNQFLGLFGTTNIVFHPGYTLRIRTLGEFKVFLGQKEIHEREWKRDKAKELFQLFVTFRNHLLSRDKIISLLWEDSDEETAERDFKVALNALYKVIEPSRKARSSPFFIQRKSLLYGLHTTAAVEIDAVEFQKLIEKGLDEADRDIAEEILQKALRLYKGDYLLDRPYAEWCFDERERLLLLYLRGAERLAQISVAKEKFDDAIYWCQQMLEKEDCWEEAYRLLMYCYYRKNNRAYAIKLYEKCCYKLKKEFGVEPMETTKQMFQMIKETNQLI